MIATGTTEVQFVARVMTSSVTADDKGVFIGNQKTSRLAFAWKADGLCCSSNIYIYIYINSCFY